MFSEKKPALEELLVVTLEDGRQAEIDGSMERMSMFLPKYLDKLLSAVALQQGEPKAKIIRNAILRELDAYIRELEKPGNNTAPYVALGTKPNEKTAPMVDYEANGSWIKNLFERFMRKEDRFPPRVALSDPSRR